MAFPGWMDRYIGATVDPWTGSFCSIYDNKTTGTQTNFFHAATEIPWQDGNILEFYKNDIRRVFLLTTAAAASVACPQRSTS